jgi:hypothetical protein
MNEMMEVIACLGKFDQNQAMCSKVVIIQYKQCVRCQCCGFVTFWDGPRGPLINRSAGSYYFISYLQDGKKNNFFSKGFFPYYFLKLHLQK